jgi:hypothetical protein
MGELISNTLNSAWAVPDVLKLTNSERGVLEDELPGARNPSQAFAHWDLCAVGFQSYTVSVPYGNTEVPCSGLVPWADVPHGRIGR